MKLDEPILLDPVYHANAYGWPFERPPQLPEFNIPSNTAARLHMLPGTPMPYVVAVACHPTEPTPRAILDQRGALSALLSHDPGVSWPDARGRSLASEVLRHGGGIVLAFATLADALTCHRQLAEAAR